MICKYNISKFLIRDCPCPPPFSGSLKINTFAYVSCITPSVTGGLATGVSYLSEVDAIMSTSEFPTMQNRAATGCIYAVGVYLTGLCNAGDLHDHYALSGSANSYDSYIGYLAAYASLTGLSGAACTT